MVGRTSLRLVFYFMPTSVECLSWQLSDSAVTPPPSIPILRQNMHVMCTDMTQKCQYGTYDRNLNVFLVCRIVKKMLYSGEQAAYFLYSEDTRRQWILELSIKNCRCTWDKTQFKTLPLILTIKVNTESSLELQGEQCWVSRMPGHRSK